MGVNELDASSPAGQRPAIELQIEELVLDGFDSRHAARIAAALEEELARLLGEGGLPQSWNAPYAVPRLETGPLQISPRHSPEMIGRQAAQAIYTGMKR